MKRNIKKLAVLVIVTVIALFIMVPWASADDHHWKNAIHGQYAMTGGNICLIAPGGFNPNLTPAAPGVGVIQTSSREGVFTFERDGTGSADVFSRNVSLTALPNGTVAAPSASTMDIAFDFTYTLEKGGTITMVVGPGPFTSTALTGPDAGKTFYITGVPMSLNGAITPDGKTITLNAGAPEVYTITQKDNPNFSAQSICHASSVLIWQHDIDHECDHK
jgi:hypothetical protein